MSESFEERFEDVEQIGEGAMGTVFKAQDPRLDRKVAVKILHQERVETKKQLARFRAEAKTTGGLEHPSIPPVYEWGENENGQPYFALKFIDGETLDSLIKKLDAEDETAHLSYSFAERVQIAIKLAEALHYAHNQNILHRDIKPANIILGRFGEVWLVDWGVAGPPSEAEEPEQEPQERLTEEATFLGTLQYAAPEQIAGCYSPASDQYSLGAVLYELFTLEPAHAGKSRMEVMKAVLQSSPKAAELYSKRPQGRVPREISVLIKRMLEKDPSKRFRHLAEVVDELKMIAGGDIRAICPHTLTKKFLFRFGKVLDNHNYWLMPLLMLWLLYPLYSLIQVLMERL